MWLRLNPDVIINLMMAQAVLVEQEPGTADWSVHAHYQDYSATLVKAGTKEDAEHALVSIRRAMANHNMPVYDLATLVKA